MSPSICASGEGRASSGTRSPLGAPPRLRPRFLGLGFSTSGQVSWDAVPAGVTRFFLSQSSGSTPRTGRNTGGHDARSRPGADCVGPRAGTAPAFRNQEHPHDGVPSTSRRRACQQIRMPPSSIAARSKCFARVSRWKAIRFFDHTKPRTAVPKCGKLPIACFTRKGSQAPIRRMGRAKRNPSSFSKSRWVSLRSTHPTSYALVSRRLLARTRFL